jgi:histidinol-phosphate aminotransferase
MIRIRPHVEQMAPYALAGLSVPDGKTPILLSQNESLRPPSPAAVQAATEALNGAMLYPDPDWCELRQALGAHHGVSPGDILCGAGSLDLIGCLARVLAGPERAVLAPQHAYPFFRSAAQVVEARFDVAPEVDKCVDVDSLLAAVRADTGLVLVANPGNPTGTRIARAELLRLREGLREDICLVIDEAYGEFADHLGETCFDMVKGGNTVVLRTFSKAYGMAGFRIGWGLFPEAIAVQMRKVMNPNNVAAASQAAATAALRDQDYMRETCMLTARLRDRVTQSLRGAGLTLYPSLANFVLIDLGEARHAEAADAFLRAEGIVLRRQGAAGLSAALRMTIGPEAATAAAVERLILWTKEYSS